MILHENEVHLWLISLDQHRKGELLHCLSAQELERYHAFRIQQSKDMYAVSHFALRTILSKYLHQSPKEITFAYHDKGKPFVPNTNLEFNLSHSHEYALLGICMHDPVGVDIEFARQIEFEQIAERFFTPNEAQKVVASDDISSSFYNCWTRKEAFIKAIGEGLSFPLNDFEVSVLSNETPSLERIFSKPGETKFWSMLNCPNLPTNYHGAIAVRKPVVELNFKLF